MEHCYILSTVDNDLCIERFLDRLSTAYIDEQIVTGRLPVSLSAYTTR